MECLPKVIDDTDNMMLLHNPTNSSPKIDDLNVKSYHAYWDIIKGNVDRIDKA